MSGIPARKCAKIRDIREGAMAVTSERQGAGTTIILDRGDRRNAIDPPTAKALRAAFRAFERDRDARGAGLWGANGAFCAGADPKADAERRRAPPRRGHTQ